MKGINGLTPKQAATKIMLGWIRAVYEGKTGEVGLHQLCEQDTQAFNNMVRHQLLKQHNRMLAYSSLEGSPIEAPKPEVVTVNSTKGSEE